MPAQAPAGGVTINGKYYRPGQYIPSAPKVSVNTRIEVDTRVLDKLIKSLNGNVAEAVQKVGYLIEGKAKLNAPVDTGALRASIYTSVKGQATSALNQARALNPDAQVTPLPTPKDDHTVYVGPSVEYAAAVEFGSGRSAAQPFLTPAVRDAERELRKQLGKAVTP